MISPSAPSANEQKVEGESEKILPASLNRFSFFTTGRPWAKPGQDPAAGRFDFSDPYPTFSHVSSSIGANFQGSAISATFSASFGVSYLYVILDGNDDPLHRTVLEIGTSGPKEYIVAQGLDTGMSL